jgi:hypothetical protein
MMQFDPYDPKPFAEALPFGLQAQDAIFRHGAELRICGCLDNPMDKRPALARESTQIVDQRLGILGALFTIPDGARHQRQGRRGQQQRHQHGARDKAAVAQGAVQPVGA